jgi:xanthine dehydrogenase accessory factor
MFGLTDDVRSALARAREAGETAALATIVSLDGGGPRPVGAQMSFTAREACGFLSGGCLEADLAGHAKAVIADGAARRLVYGHGSPWPDIRLLCGARIEILLEAVAPDDPAVGSLLAAMHARRPALWVTDGSRRQCAAPGSVQAWQGAFVRRYDPVTRLVVLGADPTALAIARLGVEAGLETTLIRPKGPAAPPPIAGLAYSREAPAAALAAIGLDPWSAVAVATHEAELDHAALVVALPSAAFFVGALGARRRVEDRRAMLRDAGLADSGIDRLHSPIGLDVGGKAPVEVAVATLAQIIQVREQLRASETTRTSGV